VSAPGEEKGGGPFRVGGTGSGGFGSPGGAGVGFSRQSDPSGETSPTFGISWSPTATRITPVVLHVGAETLQAEGKGGPSELEDGTSVSAETLRSPSLPSLPI